MFARRAIVQAAKQKRTPFISATARAFSQEVANVETQAQAPTTGSGDSK